MINDSDQWLLEGNCNVCRRNSYCNHGCKKSKLKLSDSINDILLSTLKELIHNGNNTDNDEGDTTNEE